MTAYTLQLTRGCHLVSEETAQEILAAIDAGRQGAIWVTLDPFGSDPNRRTALNLAHVILLAENQVNDDGSAVERRGLRAISGGKA